MEISFGGKPAEATYHKEKLQKLRNERVRDNKMKCVKAVTVANWSEVPEEDKAKRRRERGVKRGTASGRAVVDCGDQETYCGVSLFVAPLVTPEQRKTANSECNLTNLFATAAQQQRRDLSADACR